MHIVSSLFSYVFMFDLCDAAQQRPFYGLDSLSLLFFFFLWPKPGRMLYYLIRKFYNNARTSCNRMANYLNGFSFVVIAISSSFTISLCLSISSLPPKLLKPNAFGLVFPRMTCMTCPIYQYFIILYITFTYRLYV